MAPPPATFFELNSEACLGSCCLLRSKAKKPEKEKRAFSKGTGGPAPPKAAEAQEEPPVLEVPNVAHVSNVAIVAAVACASLLAVATVPLATPMAGVGAGSKAALASFPILASLAVAFMVKKTPAAGGKDAEGFSMDSEEAAIAAWHAQRQAKAEASLPMLEAALREARLEDPEGFLEKRGTLLRYLRACNAPASMSGEAHAAAALARLRHTLAWRHSTLLQGDVVLRSKDSKGKCHFSCPCCQKEPNAHCYFPLGMDNRERVVFYSSAPRALRSDLSGISHILCELEANLDEAEQIVWIVDFRGFGSRHADPRCGIEAIKVFAAHYPERLGEVVLLGFPAAFSFLWRCLQPMLDPVTRQKVRILRTTEEREGYLRRLWPDWMRAWLAAADELEPVPSVPLPPLPECSGDPRLSTASRVAGQ